MFWITLLRCWPMMALLLASHNIVAAISGLPMTVKAEPKIIRLTGFWPVRSANRHNHPNDQHHNGEYSREAITESGWFAETVGEDAAADHGVDDEGVHGHGEQADAEEDVGGRAEEGLEL